MGVRGHNVQPEGKALKLATLKPRVQTLGSRLAPQPKPSKQPGYRIRGRALMTLRYRHFRRNPLCVHCQAKIPPQISIAVELDHIVALTNGGTDTDDNRAGLCHSCHQLKTIEDLKAQRMR
jgi:5-methylcytosine-specific restriction enzyme A